MAETTKIEWTEATWNPWHGCHKVSAGCKNCYMFREKTHYGQDPNVVVRSKTKFYDPLKWKEPRKIFTCSWSDFFIEEADPWRDEAFAIMALTPQHTYQVLTKRPDRMLEYLNNEQAKNRIQFMMGAMAGRRQYQHLYATGATVATAMEGGIFPPKNIWLGVSVEDQKTADERIPLLLQTPATLRWLSIEPLLAPIDLSPWLSEYCSQCGHSWRERACGPTHALLAGLGRIDWAVVGGESGPNARPMHPDWARSLRDQCTAAGVPFFFKQWGEWWPYDSFFLGPTNHPYGPIPDDLDKYPALDFPENHDPRSGPSRYFIKLGKTKAGRILDGREWNEMPEVPK